MQRTPLLTIYTKHFAKLIFVITFILENILDYRPVHFHWNGFFGFHSYEKTSISKSGLLDIIALSTKWVLPLDGDF